MNTNMTGFRCFSKIRVLVLWMKVAIALEGLNNSIGSMYIGNVVNKC